MIPFIKKIFKKTKQRSFFSTIINNKYHSDWMPSNVSIDKEIKHNLVKIRAYCREIAFTNNYIRRYVMLCESNIVGENGIVLQPQVRFNNGDLDNYANKVIADAFYDWGVKKLCDVTNQYTYVELLKTIVRSVVIDGEIFVLLLRGDYNRYGFTMQLIPTDLVDDSYNVERTLEGNTIIMGIEKTPTGQPVAYYIKQPYEGRRRIPAEDMIHIYRRDRLDQTRGLPWFVSTISTLRHLDKYIEAEVIASRVAAAQMGVIETEQGEYVGDALVDGQQVMDVEPGVWRTLLPGQKFTQFTPDHPNLSFSEFSKGLLRDISAGLGISYNALVSDLESVNYSSLRQGAIEDRAMWRMLQQWLIDILLNRVYAEWLRMSLLTKAISLRESFDYYNAPAWYPRRWEWVDPVKDITAVKMAIELGIKSRTQVLAEMGFDLQEVYEQLKYEQQLYKDILTTGENNGSNINNNE